MLIADYFLIRKRRLNLAELYHRDGEYWYQGGFNFSAILALVAGIVPCVPGFLTICKVYDFGTFWADMYSYAWFLSFGISFLVYATLMLLFGERREALKSVSRDAAAERLPSLTSLTLRCAVAANQNCASLFLLPNRVVMRLLAEANQRVMVIFCCV